MPVRAKEGTTMLMTLAIILIVLWALGLVTAYTMSGLIHILLVAAIIIVLVRLIQGRGVV
jgi:low affinity Fe/Cu permease